eukprot:300585-Rhodomonas_salina.3
MGVVEVRERESATDSAACHIIQYEPDGWSACRADELLNIPHVCMIEEVSKGVAWTRLAARHGHITEKEKVSRSCQENRLTRHGGEAAA